MSERNLRHQAVKSLMLAIDLENGDQDLEAYLKYLEGLSLVVTALQKDTTNGEQWLFTDKVRRSLVNFAKESVDRIILLLKKQDRIAEKKQEGLETNVLKSPHNDWSPGTPDGKTADSFNKEHNETSPDEFGSCYLNQSAIDEEGDFYCSNAEEVSPLAAVRQENTQLSKKYAQRIINAPSSQKPQLRLELERRIAENMAIAESKQLAWDAQREKAAQHYNCLAQQKCKQLQKAKESNCKDIDVHFQEVIYSCLMFEWEKKLRTVKDALEVYPKLAKDNEEWSRRVMKKSVDMATRALRGSIRGHPLGSLVVRKQQSVCNEINSILGSRDALEASSDEVHVLLDGIVKESTGPLHVFNKIAEGIKKDLEFLEKILLSLYEPLNNDEGQLLVSQTLQKIYFPAITPSIKALLRLCVHSPKTDSGREQQKSSETSSSGVSVEGAVMESANSIQNGYEMEARFRLQSLQSLPSPCEKLDCLTEVMRSLCSWKFNGTKEGTLRPIGADDLLSRLVAVIHIGEEEGEDRLAHLLRMEAIFLEAFVPDGMLLGEAGYCVTVLCSALSV